jgi:ATP-dependent Lon protease
MMSEPFKRFQGSRELPLFPLPVVLYPGVPLPLHIFEPRYKKMLSDITATDSMFGLLYFDSEESSAKPPVGRIGCMAEVLEVQHLEDGKSNILTVGLIRCKLESYTDSSEPYYVGEVSYFEDRVEDEQRLKRIAAQVSDMFLRTAKAIRTLNDERSELPDLSNVEPEKLSFMIAAAIELDLQTKQKFLEMDSTIERLKEIKELLSTALPAYEQKAKVYSLSRGNGHSKKRLDIK